MAARLVSFLSVLREGGMASRSGGEKRTLCESFIDLWTHRDRKTIARVCRLFFEGTFRPEDQAALPEGMIQALVQTGRSEKSGGARVRIWDLLIKSVPELQGYISASDLIFGFWVDDPVSRRNIVRYLFASFPPEAVLEALKKHAGRLRKTMLSPSLFHSSDVKALPKARPGIMAEILHQSGLDPADKERFLSIVAPILNRFDLIRAIPHLPRSQMAFAGRTPRHVQLCFDLDVHCAEETVPPGFRARVKAVMSLR